MRAPILTIKDVADDMCDVMSFMRKRAQG